MVVSARIFSRDMGQFDLNRRTKIVATIGPATRAGADQGAGEGWCHHLQAELFPRDHSEHAARIATIRQVSEELGQTIGILQDLQGPKIRLGRFAEGPITLANGDPFTLTSRPVSCDKTIATVTYDKLADEVTAGSGSCSTTAALR